MIIKILWRGQYGVQCLALYRAVLFAHSRLVSTTNFPVGKQKDVLILKCDTLEHNCPCNNMRTSIHLSTTLTSTIWSNVNHVHFNNETSASVGHKTLVVLPAFRWLPKLCNCMQDNIRKNKTRKPDRNKRSKNTDTFSPFSRDWRSPWATLTGWLLPQSITLAPIKIFKNPQKRLGFFLQ